MGNVKYNICSDSPSANQHQLAGVNNIGAAKQCHRRE